MAGILYGCVSASVDKVLIAPPPAAPSTVELTGSSRDIDAPLFVAVLMDSSAPRDLRARAAQALVDSGSTAAWEQVNVLLAAGGDGSTLLVDALHRRGTLSAATIDALSLARTQVAPDVQTVIDGLLSKRVAATNDPAIVTTGIEAGRRADWTDQRLLSLAEELMAKTPSRDQFALAESWMADPAIALREAGLVQVERSLREGTQLTEAQRNVVATLLRDVSPRVRGAAVRTIAGVGDDAALSTLLARLQTESDGAVAAELLRVTTSAAATEIGPLAEQWMLNAVASEAAAGALLSALTNGYEVLPDSAGGNAVLGSWNRTPSPNVAKVVGLIHGRSSADSLWNQLDTADAPLTVAIALALFEMGEGDRLAALVKSDPSIADAQLSYMASKAKTADDVKSILDRLRPADWTTTGMGMKWTAALLLALESVDAEEFLAADALIPPADLTDRDRARVGAELLSTLQSAKLNSQKELAAAVAIRTAEHLISAGQFTEAIQVLSEDLSLANPMHTDALRLAAGLAQGGGAALPARPANETREQSAEAVERALAQLARLNSSAAVAARKALQKHDG